MKRVTEKQVYKWLATLPTNTLFDCQTERHGYKRIERYSINGEIRLILDIFSKWPRCLAYIKH